MDPLLWTTVIPPEDQTSLDSLHPQEAKGADIGKSNYSVCV